MADYSPYFVNLEYSLDQYFEKHMAQTVVTAKQILDRKQSEETGQYLDRSRRATGGFGDSMLHVTMAIQDANANGKYHKIHAEQLVEGLIKQFGKDQRLSQDIQTMTVLWRASAVSQLGLEKYKQLSAQCPCGDLAAQYVDERISSLIVGRLAKMNVPKSSLEYIVSEGARSSILGIIYDWTYDNASSLDKEIREKTKDMYDPSTGEKLSSEAVAFVLDGWTAAGKAPAAAVKFLAGDAAIRGAILPLDGKGDGLSEMDRFVGQNLFGGEQAMGAIRSEARNVNPNASEDLLLLNENLNKKIFKPSVNQKNVKEVKNTLISAVGDNGNDLLFRVRKGFSSFGISVKDGPAPGWIDKMSDKDVISSAAHYTAYALEMKAKNVNTIKVGKNTMTLQEIAQRAYDYARAANERYSARQNVAASQSQPVSQGQDVRQGGMAMNVSDPAAMQQQFSQAYQTAYHQPLAGMQGGQQAGTGGGLDFSGWQSMIDKAGLGAVSSLGSNLGSTIAMLPELMVGMFTGKIPGFSLKDNTIPLSLLMISLLFGKRMNPLLKFMMLGLGGAMLLNNANKAVRGETGSEVRSQKYYRRYNDEPLSPRLSNVEMRGNTILANVDGVPTILTIKSDRVLDAYNKGAIPLNTLCNAVLRKFDDMDVKIVENYERVAAQEMEDQQQQVKLR